MPIGAVVLLPKGYDENATRRYPVVYTVGHFSERAPFGFTFENCDTPETPDAKAARLARTARGLGPLGGSGSAAAAPSGPEKEHMEAQDRTVAAGKKLVDQEKWKRDENPFDAYPRFKAQAKAGVYPKPEDNFRWRYHGLFYVAPAQNSYMCRLRIPNGSKNTLVPLKNA